MKKNYIPTIDISSLLKNLDTKRSKKVIKKIEKACVEVGFFQIINHGISKAQVSNISNVGRKFFNSSKNNKIKLAPKKWNKRNKNIYRGYFPNDVNGKEGLDIGDTKITSDYAKNIKNQYIEYLNLRKSIDMKSIETLKKYFDKIFYLSEILFKSVIKVYKEDTFISKRAFSRLKTLSTLRFNFYPKQSKPVEISKEDGTPLGCETHVDSGIFTILYQDSVGGLQVQNRKNKKWYDVPYNRNALIVNTGKALEFLSKGKFKATNHRVLWNQNERMSIPFFFEPSYDFKMNSSFFHKRKINNSGLIYEKFLNKSLKKFVEYKR